MGKTKQTTKNVEQITVRFDLFDLPTAQHKAGLAGLILLIRWMETIRPTINELPALVEVKESSATISFSKLGTQKLFDEVYAAKIVEVAVKSKWPGSPPKREDEVLEKDESGKERKAKRFIYEVVQPAGNLLAQYLPEDADLWLKLWRDMLWAIPRGNPQSRQPFEDRANDKPCREGAAAWEDLLKVNAARAKNTFHTTAVASSLWIGAQAVNAESVPFEGRAEQNLLLHFWPLTTLVFVPQVIDISGESDFKGYALAIPEVSDLNEFTEHFPQVLSELSPDKRGYRPANAIIDLPAQSSLAYFDHLSRILERKARGKFGTGVAAIEFTHLDKAGNNIKSLASGRIAANESLVVAYRNIMGNPDRPSPYRNPLFRAGLLLALLNHPREDWHRAFTSMLLECPWPFFVRNEKSPRGMPWFGADAAARFTQEQNDFDRLIQNLTQQENDSTMSETTPQAPPRPLSILVYHLVRTYVQRKTESRSGMTWDQIKNAPRQGEKLEVPQAWREAREKVASDVFLALRSRRDQDFIEYFTGTLGSVAQWLPEGEFAIVASALLEKPDDVKALALLALSANS